MISPFYIHFSDHLKNHTPTPGRTFPTHGGIVLEMGRVVCVRTRRPLNLSCMVGYHARSLDIQAPAENHGLKVVSDKEIVWRYSLGPTLEQGWLVKDIG